MVDKIEDGGQKIFSETSVFTYDSTRRATTTSGRIYFMIIFSYSPLPKCFLKILFQFLRNPTGIVNSLRVRKEELEIPDPEPSLAAVGIDYSLIRTCGCNTTDRGRFKRMVLRVSALV